MMRKTIKSGKKKAEVLDKTGEVVPPKPPIKAATWSFPVGARFILNGKMNFVRKAFHADNTDMRLVFCDGTEEIVELRTLRMEADEDPEFVVTD